MEESNKEQNVTELLKKLDERLEAIENRQETIVKGLKDTIERNKRQAFWNIAVIGVLFGILFIEEAKGSILPIIVGGLSILVGLWFGLIEGTNLKYKFDEVIGYKVDKGVYIISNRISRLFTRVSKRIKIRK